MLERDGWTGLEEVTRLLNGHEFAVSGSNTRRYSCNVTYWFLKMGVQETRNLLSVIRVTDYNQSGDRILISWCLKRTIKAPSACLELMNNEGFVSQQAATAPIQEGRTTLSASSSSCSSAAAPSLRFQLYVSSAEREVSWMLTLHENTCLHPPQSSLLLFCRWESSFTSAVLTLNLTDRRRIVFSVLLIGLHILNFFQMLLLVMLKKLAQTVWWVLYSLQ